MSPRFLFLFLFSIGFATDLIDLIQNEAKSVTDEKTILFSVSVFSVETTMSSTTFRASASSSATFVWLTDIHYDPYFGQAQAMNRHGGTECSDSAPTLAQYGCDSPETLVSSAFDGVRQYYAGEIAAAAAATTTTTTKPDFVILTGDFCRHQMEMLDNAKTKELPSILKNVLTKLRYKVGDDVPYLPMIGNDDAIPDYFLDITDASPTSLLKIMSNAFLENQILTPDEAEMFGRGGFYKRQVGTRLTILCLNTVIYSASHVPAIPPYDQDPLDQFTWLEQELKEAASTDHAVLIVGHIPPTIGSYAHMDMWREDYRSLYNQIVIKYQPTIQAQLFGHFHTDEFRLHDQMPPLFIGPSITPVFRNNPAFRIMHYDRSSGELQDIESYSLNITDPSAEWKKLYSFREAYGMVDLSTASFRLLVDRLSTEKQLLQDFLFHSKSGVLAPKAIQCLEDTETCAQTWVCTITSETSEVYGECLNTTNKAKNTLLWIGLGISLGLLLFVAWIIFRACRLRRRRSQYDIPCDKTIVDTNIGNGGVTVGGGDMDELPVKGKEII